jgi:acyl dehydratase
MQIDEIRASIGREAGVSDWFTVTQDLINRFADLSGDHQWIHVDLERARRESPFGTTIAHGFLTVALMTPLVSQAVDQGMESGRRLNYGFNKLRFPAPVRAGSRIRARVTPNSLREVEGGHEVAWGVVIEVENQEKPAVAAEWLLRIYG